MPKVIMTISTSKENTHYSSQGSPELPKNCSVIWNPLLQRNLVYNPRLDLSLKRHFYLLCVCTESGDKYFLLLYVVKLPLVLRDHETRAGVGPGESCSLKEHPLL